MKSKVAEATIRSGGLISILATKRISQWIRSASLTSRTTDPATHSEESAKAAAAAAAAEEELLQRELGEKSTKVKEENVPFSSGKIPYMPQPTLDSIPVEPPVKPINQQKRKSHTTSSVDASCVGVDGSPLWKLGGDGVDEFVEYYKDHKPSPLSEVEFVDTRKPITRATDGTADSVEYGRGADVIGWREEQLDTAEEALQRAVRIWKENAMRGDPDSPQSRALRALLGELN
ncbi:uncharacterized protein LOC122092287 [Macadamia integrifolia]|uniref:uncharacterized protein LOC122092287 n=1 Tax=Macadamia integrifolia TaxID=60698 RepID=UPI001C4EE75A|nr:uncharacterized protein LOC122092287 [Macadamia integrifolia]